MYGDVTTLSCACGQMGLRERALLSRFLFLEELRQPSAIQEYLLLCTFVNKHMQLWSFTDGDT